jgi:hypothetical protein
VRVLLGQLMGDNGAVFLAIVTRLTVEDAVSYVSAWVSPVQ